MPLTPVISNQSSIRSGAASILRYVAIHTPDVVFQFQPSSSATKLVNTRIPYSTILSGVATDVGEAMTVIITPTSDYVSDLQNDAENCAITYVHIEGAIGGNLYIGETAYQFSTSEYVTVVRDSRVFQRKPRLLANGTIYMDYSLTFRKPKPRVTGLYSDVVRISSGSTVTYAFSDVAAVSMSGGSSSFTWLWDLDGGSFSSGTSASQNPTGSFSAGTYNIRLKVTDSNSIVNVMSILLVVLPADLNSVIDDTITARNLENNDEGHAVGLQLSEGTDLSAIVPGSMCMVITYCNFADGTSQLTCDMVGWLGETSEAVLGDEQYLRLQSADIAVLDIAQKIASINIRSYYMDEVTTPTKWTEFTRVTPLDGAWFLLSEFTTVGNLACVEFPADYENKTVRTIDLPQSNLTDVLSTLALRNELDGIQYTPNGEIIFVDSLPYATSTVRDAADTVVTLAIRDLPSIRPSKPDIAGKAVQYVLVGAQHYVDRQQAYFGQAPAVLEDGILQEEVDGIVFDNTLSTSQVLARVGRAASDHYFAANANLIVDLDMLPGYYVLRARQDVWVKLSIAAGELLSGETFDSNTRFLLLSVSQEYDPEAGTLRLSGVIREETGNNDSYSIRSQAILPEVIHPVMPPYPPIVPYPQIDSGSGASGGGQDNVYGAEMSDASGGGVDSSSPPGTSATGSPGQVGSASVSLEGGASAADFTSEVGKTYTLVISGSGDVAKSNIIGDQFDQFAVPADQGSATSGNEDTVIGQTYIVEVAGAVVINNTTDPPLEADALYSTHDGWETLFNMTPIAQVEVNGANISPLGDTYNEDHVYYTAVVGDGNPVNGRKKAAVYNDNEGSHIYTVYETLPFSGDAFYYKWNLEDPVPYGGVYGLNLDGSPLSGSAGAFNENNEYVISGVAGTGSAFSFEFLEANLLDNEGGLSVEIYEEG